MLKFGKPEDGWSRLKSFKSLEDVVRAGKSFHDEKEEPFHTALRNFPERLYYDYMIIRKKHKNVKSFRGFTLFVTKAGAIGMWDLSTVKTTRMLNLKVELGYEMKLPIEMNLVGATEKTVLDDLYMDMGFGKREKVDVWMFRWVESMLREIAEDNFVSFSTAIRACILKGLSMSKRWLPEYRTKLYRERYELFERKIREKQKEIKDMLDATLEAYFDRYLRRVTTGDMSVTGAKREVSKFYKRYKDLIEASGEEYVNKFKKFIEVLENARNNSS